MHYDDKCTYPIYYTCAHIKSCVISWDLRIAFLIINQNYFDPYLQPNQAAAEHKLVFAITNVKPDRSIFQRKEVILPLYIFQLLRSGWGNFPFSVSATGKFVVNLFLNLKFAIQAQNIGLGMRDLKKWQWLTHGLWSGRAWLEVRTYQRITPSTKSSSPGSSG